MRPDTRLFFLMLLAVCVFGLYHYGPYMLRSAGLLEPAVGLVGQSPADPSKQRFNIQWRKGEPPFYIDIDETYLNRTIRPTGWGDTQLNIIFTYPGFEPSQLGAPRIMDKQRLLLRFSYTGGKGTHKDFYLENFDLIRKAPDEKIGEHLMGYIYGRGPEFRIMPYGLRYIGGDVWFYMDQKTNTFANLTCLEAGEPSKYVNCVSSLVLDDRYSALFSISGEMLPNFPEFVSDLRKFLYSLEVTK